MLQQNDIHPSCRICMFYGKCFGKQTLDAIMPGERKQGHVLAFPVEFGGQVSRLLQAGSGAPVLFIHGAGSRADYWRYVLPLVADAGRMAIALDLPGHGFAARCGNAGDWRSWPAAIGAMLGELSEHPVALVGAGSGGDLAVEIARLFPQRVSTVVLAGSTGGLCQDDQAMDRLRRTVWSRSRDSTRERLRRMIASPMLVTPELVEEEFRINGAASRDAMAALAEATTTAQPSAGETLRALAAWQKLHLVWGERDLILPAELARAVQRTAGNPPLDIIPNAGHLPAFEKPGLFAQALLRALVAELRPARRAV